MTTCMLSCPGPEPDVVQLLQAGCETEAWLTLHKLGMVGGPAPLVSPSG